MMNDEPRFPRARLRTESTSGHMDPEESFIDTAKIQL